MSSLISEILEAYHEYIAQCGEAPVSLKLSEDSYKLLRQELSDAVIAVEVSEDGSTFNGMAMSVSKCGEEGYVGPHFLWGLYP